MKVSIFAGLEFPRGRSSARRIATLATALTEAGTEVVVSVPYSSERSTGVGYAIRQAYVPSKVSDLRGGRARIPAWIHLFARTLWVATSIVYLFRHRPSVAYLYQPWLDSALIGLAARCLMIKVVTEVVDLYPPGSKLNPLLRAVCKSEALSLRLCARLSHGIVAISSTIEDWARRQNPKARHLRMPIIVDLAPFRQPAGTHPDFTKTSEPPVLVYTGSYAHSQGVRIALQALAAVKSSGRKVRMITAGASGTIDSDDPTSIARDLGVEDLVTDYGYVDGKDIPQLQSRAFALLMPKLDLPVNHAGLSTKLGEYLASGRPVIASDVSDLREYLTDRMNVILTQPGSCESLATAIAWVLGNQREANAIGQAGRVAAEQHFDSRQNAIKVRTMFQEIL